MYSVATSVRPSDDSDSEEDMDIKKLLKEVEYLGMPNYIILFSKPNCTYSGRDKILFLFKPFIVVLHQIDVQ